MVQISWSGGLRGSDTPAGIATTTVGARSSSSAFAGSLSVTRRSPHQWVCVGDDASPWLHIKYTLKRDVAMWKVIICSQCTRWGAVDPRLRRTVRPACLEHCRLPPLPARLTHHKCLGRPTHCKCYFGWVLVTSLKLHILLFCHNYIDKDIEFYWKYK